MERVDQLTSPLVLGKFYLVPCLKRNEILFRNANGEWIVDDQGKYFLQRVESYESDYFIPVINHPHNDVENGQKYTHYHMDDRFEKISSRSTLDIRLIEIRPKKDSTPITYNVLRCIRTSILRNNITSVLAIRHSKLKHDCIYKGKCPHRGYDLSNEIPDENGIITCPLHGLQFDAKTLKVLNHDNSRHI